MSIDLEGFLRARWVVLGALCLATACGNGGGGDAQPVTTAATLHIGAGQPPGGGLGAVPGGLAGPQGQPGSGGPGVAPPTPGAAGNPGSGQPGAAFPGGTAQPSSGVPAGPGTPQKGGYSSGR